MKVILDLWMKITTVIGGAIVFITVWAMDALDHSGITYQLNDYVMYIAYGVGLLILGLIYYEIRRK